MQESGSPDLRLCEGGGNRENVTVQSGDGRLPDAPENKNVQSSGKLPPCSPSLNDGICPQNAIIVHDSPQEALGGSLEVLRDTFTPVGVVIPVISGQNEFTASSDEWGRNLR